MLLRSLILAAALALPAGIALPAAPAAANPFGECPAGSFGVVVPSPTGDRPYKLCIYTGP